MRTRPTAYFIILSLVAIFLAFKVKALLIPAAIVVAIIGLTYVYSHQRSRPK